MIWIIANEYSPWWNKSKNSPLLYKERCGGEVSFVVAYLDYKVLIGKFTNGSFSFFNNETIEPNILQRIRIFNKNEELLLWRSEGILKGRYRKDDDGVEVWAVDNYQVLFGTNYPKNNPPVLIQQQLLKTGEQR